MIVYKLVRLKGDKYYPLFINKNAEYVLGEWHEATETPTKGFAIRKGFHCCTKPIAPHLKETLASGEKRVWLECEVRDFNYFNRPQSQGGKWVLAQHLKPVKQIKGEVK